MKSTVALASIEETGKRGILLLGGMRLGI